MIQTDLAPGLLLAMPHLLDPNFHRAVVLMVEHNDEGSFGVIVNQPSVLTVSELLTSLELAWEGDPEAVVWRGGPVMPTHGWVLHEPVDALPMAPVADDEAPGTGALEGAGTIPVGAHLALSSGSLSVLRTVAQGPPARVRVLLGYAGWGPGQLTREMAHGSWLHADLSPALVFDTPPEDMWERALRSIGIDPETIVHGAGVN